jgi:hypothetical protein
VHPRNSCRLWEASNARLAARTMPLAVTLHIVMLVRIPIGRRLLHRLLDLLPALQAPSFVRLLTDHRSLLSAALRLFHH